MTNQNWALLRYSSSNHLSRTVTCRNFTKGNYRFIEYIGWVLCSGKNPGQASWPLVRTLIPKARQSDRIATECHSEANLLRKPPNWINFTVSRSTPELKHVKILVPGAQPENHRTERNMKNNRDGTIICLVVEENHCNQPVAPFQVS